MVPDTELSENIRAALDALRRGEIVMVYDVDGREEETDLTVASQFISPDVIHTLRSDGGGLVCSTMTCEIAERFSIPFMVDIFKEARERYPVLAAMVPDDIPYDAISSFSVTVNARDTFTGITDIDRANTIKKFADIIASDRGTDPQEDITHFGKVFRAPGHVHLLVAQKGLTETRQGHTELCTALVEMAGLTPSATICEMMASTGGSRRRTSTMEYAERNGHVFVNGQEIIEAWKKWSG